MNENKKSPVDLLRDALSEIVKLKNENRQLKSQKNEPIAIIGMACRFADGIKNTEDFWKALIEGRNTIKDVPASRWDKDAYYDPDKNTPGKMNLKKIGAIKNVDLFDPEFFSISPRDAEDMDPQHRLLLEVTWEALEDAGIVPDSLLESNTGVFTSILNHDYSDMILMNRQEQYANPYSALSYWGCIAAGRISYFLGLNGPNVAIDTGCSGSIITVHDACISLRNHECDLALAGGCHLVLSPERVMNYVRVGVLSPTGACRTFSDDADGFAKGEGCGMIVLKRLSDAIRDNDRILALIKGSAINHDGASAGLTAPSGPAQEKVIKAAQKSAGVTPNSIDYIEAHGTGTPLGDPIEFRALNNVFKSKERQENPLLVGAVKTNLGHLEAAAGIASIIKVILSLNHELIPPHINFKELNKHIDIGIIPAKITLKATSWKTKDKPRLAGISSFSLSGSNAHMILEEAPKQESSDAAEGPYLLLFSAKNEDSLKRQINNLKIYLAAHPEVNLADVAYTLQVGRTHFKYRSALICHSHKKMEEGPLPDNAKQWLEGKEVDWKSQYTNQKRRRISLPTYPFQGKRYWSDAAIPMIGKKIETVESSDRLTTIDFDELGKTLEASDSRLKTGTEYITKYVKSVLKIPEDIKLKVDQGFFEMGMDSIVATELVRIIQKSVGNRIQVESTIAFDYPSIAALTEHLIKQLGLHVKEEVKDKVKEEVSKLSLEELLKEAEREDESS